MQHRAGMAVQFLQGVELELARVNGAGLYCTVMAWEHTESLLSDDFNRLTC